MLSQSDVNQIDILSEPINIQLHSQLSDNSHLNKKAQEKKLSSAKSTLDVFQNLNNIDLPSDNNLNQSGKSEVFGRKDPNAPAGAKKRVAAKSIQQRMQKELVNRLSQAKHTNAHKAEHSEHSGSHKKQRTSGVLPAKPHHRRDISKDKSAGSGNQR